MLDSIDFTWNSPIAVLSELPGLSSAVDSVFWPMTELREGFQEVVPEPGNM